MSVFDHIIIMYTHTVMLSCILVVLLAVLNPIVDSIFSLIIVYMIPQTSVLVVDSA